MGRRIEVELTSTREDGSWTWRAAGAKQPKGELSGNLLYTGAKVGDVVKVEADFHIDGIEVVEVFAPKAKKERSNILELKTRPVRDDELVTTQRVAKGRGGGRGRRGDRPNRDRGDRRGGAPRAARPDRPQRPKPKRLRPKRVHRDALLASVPEEHRPIVEQVVRDGMPGVRAAIEKQNVEAKTAGKPEIESAPVLSIAEKHVSAARLAEWRDRADAALADVDELDLRDLRSVVVVGNDVARDDESREISEQLKTALNNRMEKDHEQWLADLRNAVSDGRVVRALRLSSRPVKAGAPLPTELAGELSRQATVALGADVEPSRWAVVLDALAFSPVRSAVTPAGIPSEPGDELIDEVKRLSDRIPAIAALFGVDPAEVPKRLKRRRSSRSDAGRGKPEGKKGKPTRKKGDESSSANGRNGKSDTQRPGSKSTTPAAPVSQASDTEASKPEASKPEASKPEASDTEASNTEESTSDAAESRTDVAESPADVAESKPEPTTSDTPVTDAVEQAASDDTPETVDGEPSTAEPVAVVEAEGPQNESQGPDSPDGTETVPDNPEAAASESSDVSFAQVDEPSTVEESSDEEE